MTDIYQATSANLSEPVIPFDGIGSVANGIAGNYSFNIGDIISEAWAKTDGRKGTIWMGFLFYMIVIVPVALIFRFLAGSSLAAGFVFQIIQMAIALPFITGLYMIGVKIAAGEPTSGKEVFAYLGKSVNLVITGIMMYILIVIGFLLLILPGIYLGVSYSMAIQLVAEKNLSPWEALETSRKAIHHNWFKVFGLLLVLMIIIAIASIPLGIGLIWAMPLFSITYGTLYTKIFGYGVE